MVLLSCEPISQILGRIEWSSPLPLTVEHRATPREIPVHEQPVVDLMEWKGTPVTKGRLLNISAGGALIHIEGMGEPHRPLWIRLDKAPETGWIAADVVRFDRPQELAINFHSPCPLEFFLAATHSANHAHRGGDESELN
jgi:hypothetical protein